MLYVNVRPINKLEYGLFLNFSYSSDRVSHVKALPNRRYHVNSKEWEVPLSDFSLLEEMVQASNVFEKLVLGGEVEMLHQKKHIKKLAVQAKNEHFKTTPFSYQYEGIQYGLDHDKWLLGDEMGLGKTLMISYIALLRKKHQGIKHCLIICGVNSIKYNWQDEILKHTHEDCIVIDGSTKKRVEILQSKPDAFFYILNIEAIRSKEILDVLVDSIREGEIDMIAVDEVHKCKNPTSLQGKALLQLNPPLKIAATGTPLMNNPLDLYMPLRWLDKDKHSFFIFKKFFCEFGGYQDKQVIGYKNLDLLQEQLNKSMLRRKKNDVLDLPPKIRKIDYVELEGDQLRLYKSVLQELKSQIDKIKLDPNPLAQMIRLRQATGAPSILTTQEVGSAKAVRLLELIDEIILNNEKVLIFSNWSQVIEEVLPYIKDYMPICITGETKTLDRQMLVEKFQTDVTCHIAIGTIGAMGTGLTMTKASHVIFLDSPWNMAIKEQAEDRAYRIGTTKSVMIHTLVAKGTLDEKIEEILIKKGSYSDMLVDGDKKTMELLLQYLID